MWELALAEKETPGSLTAGPGNPANPAHRHQVSTALTHNEPEAKGRKKRGSKGKMCTEKWTVQHTATGTLKGTPKARWVEAAVTRPHV